MGRVTGRQVDLLTAVGLPVTPPEGPGTDEFLARMKLDKKTAAGQLRFVLPSCMGHVELVEGVPEELVRQLL